jgi:hypothetical protein
MSRISVGTVTTQSYSFAFGNFFGVLGIVWLPLAIEFAGLYLLAIPYVQAMAALFQNLPQADGRTGMPPEIAVAMQSLSRYAILFVVGSLFLRAVMMLGITQEALGVRKGPRFAYFAIGRDVWRLFGAYFIFYILLQVAVVAIIVVVAIPSVILGVIVAVLWGNRFAHSVTGGVFVGLGIFAIAVLVYGGILYFVMRLGFLLTPVVVVEKKIDIARVWNLSKDNAGRMFLACLALFLPIFIVCVAMSLAALVYAAFPAFASLPHNASGAEFGAHMSAFFNILLRAWFVILPVAVIFATLFYGLAGSVMTFCYRALTPPLKPLGEAPALG